MASRAVIFTHLHGREKLHDAGQLDDFDRRRRAFFKACLRCRNVGIVFVYSSFGIESFMKSANMAEPSIPLYVLDGEQRIHDAVQIVIDRAAAELRPRQPEAVRDRGPKFVFIGVRELASHLLRLQRINPALVRSLATKEGSFTYDSPKYAEAILRLVRSRRDWAGDPIVRVDIDVEVNETAIQKILSEAERCARKPGLRYWWFSGCYEGTHPDDPVNVYAVRQHWLVQERLVRGRGTATRRTYELPEAAQSFLVDIAEIGATQMPSQTPDAADDPRLSPAARAVIAKRKNRSKHRGTPQVISGAGLVASSQAIFKLPPFMNAPEMVVWIDDHLKRLLHEAVGDLLRGAIERVPNATMKQDRFPEGISTADLDRSNEYFRRLLNGCLMEAAILDPHIDPAVDELQRGPLARAIRTLLDNGKVDESQLREELRLAVEVRFDEVMDIWRNADYGDSRLRNWAAGLQDGQIICNGIVGAAMDYVELFRLWRDHVAAIEGMDPQDAYWAFTKPHESPRETETREPRIAIRGDRKKKPARRRMRLRDVVPR